MRRTVRLTTAGLGMLAVFLAGVTASSAAGDGELDPDFGVNGKQAAVFSALSSRAEDLAIQPDGKIVVAGSGFGGPQTGTVVARFHANGQPDLDFGDGGKFLDQFGLGAYALALQPDGKILIATTVNGSPADFGVARYEPDGSLDTSFGSGGYVMTDVGADEFATGLAVQDDGKIVVAGYSRQLGTPMYDFAVARYTASGALDTTFSSDGKLTTDFGGLDTGSDVAVSEDGTIVVVGYSSPFGSLYADFALARYDSDGSLDTSFGGDGLVTTDFGLGEIGQSVVLQRDGKIVVGGSTGVPNEAHDFALARYNANGSLDTSFDTDGKASTDLGGHDLGADLSVHGDGSIVLVGVTHTPPSASDGWALVRYLSAGALDTSFGVGGKVTADFGVGSSDRLLGVAIRDDGRVLVAGSSGADVVVGRYRGSGGTGLLRVTTAPAVPSQIVVDGVARDTWGLNWLKLPPGEHTVSFTHVEGYTEPAPQVVSVTVGQTTTLTGTFVPNGSLRVLTSPALPGTISVDGIARNDWGLWTDLPVGAHQVCFGQVQGYDAPACEQVSVSAGSLATVTGTYSPNAGAPGPTGLGYLRVTTSPALPSQLGVDGVARDSWGLNWLKLAPGSYTLRFSHVEGYDEPEPQTVIVVAGQTTTVEGQFTQLGFMRLSTLPAVPGTISIDGFPRDDWGAWTDVATGVHEACWGPVSGLTAPQCRTLMVTPGGTAAFVGSYS